VQCGYSVAMGSCCAFSVLLFLTYIAVVSVLLRFKDDILSSGSMNEDYSIVSTNEMISDHEHNYKPHRFDSPKQGNRTFPSEQQA
jgi:cytochrome c-type biogenesis protein CcmE